MDEELIIRKLEKFFQIQESLNKEEDSLKFMKEVKESIMLSRLRNEKLFQVN